MLPCSGEKNDTVPKTNNPVPKTNNPGSFSQLDWNISTGKDEPAIIVSTKYHTLAECERCASQSSNTMTFAGFFNL